MRPILLEFSGLHSYREPQRIDFTQLLGGGLFGIFGRTGSGKSTVLDAITLGLYGKVERAEHNTRGILNHAEKALTVKFTFELHGPEGAVQYRVERKYNRDGDAGLRSAHHRLVQIASDGETVLADKERDVTEKVREVLGLTVEDFTRAVVLPQGKFAEFLKLEDAKRRSMLQRLFTLGQYGEQLNGRLRSRVTAVEEQQAKLAGEQSGLGNASAEVVSAAETHAAEAINLLRDAENALQQAESVFRESERVWALQQELAQINAGLASWATRATDMDSWREESEAAHKAELVRAPLIDQSDSNQRVSSANNKWHAAQSELNEATGSEQLASAAYRSARDKRHQEAPRLTERLLRLQQAAALEVELQSLGTEVQDLQERVEKGRTLTTQTQQELERLERETEQLRQEKDEVRAQREQLDIPADYRSSVQRGLLALSRFRQAQAALLQAEQRLEARKAELVAVRAVAEREETARRTATEKMAEHDEVLRVLESEPPEQAADLQAHADWLVRTEVQVRAVADAEGAHAQAEQSVREAGLRREAAAEEAWALDAEESAARQGMDEARGAVAAAETVLETARRADYASNLAAGLTEGESCPVCGSAHHPRPAANRGAHESLQLAQSNCAEASSAVRSAEQKLERVARSAAEARARKQVAEAQVRSAQDGAAKAAASVAEARTRLPQSWRDCVAAELPALWKQESEAHRIRQNRLQHWREQLDEWRRVRQELADIASQAANSASSAAATLQARQKARDEAAAEALQAADSVGKTQTELDHERGGLRTDQLDEESLRIAKADHEAAALWSRLSDLEDQLKRHETDLRERRLVQQKYEQALQERLMQHASAAQAKAERERQWQALSSGAPTGPQLDVTQAELTQLEQAEAKFGELAEAAARRKAQADAACAAAQRELELASQRVTQAASALQDVLSQAGFTDAGSAAAALRPPDRRKQLDEALREYDREGDRLQSRRQELIDLLQGRSLDDEGWAAHHATLTEAKNLVEQRQEVRGRAAQVWEDLQAKHIRWTQLEEDRARLDKQRSHLGELQRLLRGNAFVDFLAEDQMAKVAREASARLGQLTQYRYALETDASGGFVIRDDGNGGVRRPVSTLSGGETFLTSLALALALSAEIQLRGHYPLEFFFLDEGFGTLDPDLLTVVIDTLERLHFENLHVGIISHVPELRNRIQRRLVVEPAEPGGRGSRIRLELA